MSTTPHLPDDDFDVLGTKSREYSLLDAPCACHDVPLKTCPVFMEGRDGAMIKLHADVRRARPIPDPWPMMVIETDLNGQHVRGVISFVHIGDGSTTIERFGSGATLLWSDAIVVTVRAPDGTVLWRRA